MVGQVGIQDIVYDVADPKKYSKYGKTAEAAVEAWNNNFKGRSKLVGLEPPPGFREPPPIANDAFKRPKQLNRTGPAGATPALSPNALLAPSQAPGFLDTSEYFMGEVAVGIILPESTGAASTENWDTTRQNYAVSEIQAALNWWDARDPNARLTFVYDVRLSVQTAYEPITRPQSDEGLWIAEVMANLGFSSGNYFDRVYSYLNNLRNALGTDWAFAIFVVDSLNDSDGYFSDGYFAYAYLGGPFEVMTYDNDYYGIFNMDAVTAHETGHIFYALDEYASAGYGCTASSGYLNIQNQNSAYPYAGACLTNVASIMRGQVSPYTAGAVDSYARQQVGWRDLDGDTVMDILDFEPQTTLNPYSPDPTSDSTPTFTGSATASSSAYPNNNPLPWSSGNSITINKIATVEYRINSGPWISTTPSDGAFDGTSEAFTFTTALLADGTYTFEARAVHTAGAADSTAASDILGIVTQYQLTISVSPPGGGSTNPAVGSYMYDSGTYASVTATAATGYSFYYWSLDGTNVGSSSSYAVMMNSAHILTAFFRSTSSISVGVSPTSISLGSSVTISGAITPTQPSPGIQAGTSVLLANSSDGGNSWSVFVITQTDGSGTYSIVWFPPYSGTYQLKASWAGNENYAGASSTAATLTVTGSRPPQISLLVSGPGTATKGTSVTFDVLVANPDGSGVTTTLYIEVSGPGGYYYFDTLQVTLAAAATGRFQLTWQVPSGLQTGDYRVVVGLIPPTPASVGQTLITIT